MSVDQLRQPAINFLPDLVRHHGFQRRAGQLDRQIQLPPVTAVDDRALRSAVRLGRSGEKPRHLLDRLLRCRQDRCAARDASRARPAASMLEAQMRAAPVADDGMNFIHDQRPNGCQQPSPGLRGQQQIERLRRRHQNVRRLADDRLSLRRRCIAGPHFCADIHIAAFGCSNASRIAASGCSLRFL